MKAKLYLFLLFSFSHFFISPLSSQVRLRDIYAAAPDSIFPLLTANGRLDQIDFRENGMQAVVKNRFDEPSELLVLTDRFLRMRLSETLTVEMRLLPDSTFLLAETFAGPAADSRIRRFDTEWHELPQPIGRPAVAEFLADDIDPDVRLALEALPLVGASLSPDDDSITFELQLGELTPEQRKQAEGKVRRIERDYER